MNHFGRRLYYTGRLFVGDCSNQRAFSTYPQCHALELDIPRVQVQAVMRLQYTALCSA
jgi:hypothetical protein